MKNSYIKALRREKEAIDKSFSIGHAMNWWKKEGRFNETLYLQITKIKAQ
jgi:hypothetical protein